MKKLLVVVLLVANLFAFDIGTAVGVFVNTIETVKELNKTSNEDEEFEGEEGNNPMIEQEYEKAMAVKNNGLECTSSNSTFEEVLNKFYKYNGREDNLESQIYFSDSQCYKDWKEYINTKIVRSESNFINKSDKIYYTSKTTFQAINLKSTVTHTHNPFNGGLDRRESWTGTYIVGGIKKMEKEILGVDKQIIEKLSLLQEMSGEKMGGYEVDVYIIDAKKALTSALSSKPDVNVCYKDMCADKPMLLR